MKIIYRQCLPFMLRRSKSDVLKDLPPKIIQDYYCELSPLQKLLYEDFAKSKAKRSIDNTVENEGITKDDRSEKISHIFQVNLIYLKISVNIPNYRLFNISKNCVIIRRWF